MKTESVMHTLFEEASPNVKVRLPNRWRRGRVGWKARSRTTGLEFALRLAESKAEQDKKHGPVKVIVKDGVRL